ncbi:hypothetical protein [Arthrobacter flavus]|uniref:Apea-like HEPN domain-containing protein n=1 Tax=Arthrobacter flavus TaxID=95172 RepID=A0ABW4Q8I3_9MICC
MGTIVGLKEVLECIEGVSNKQMTKDIVAYVAPSMIRQVARDEGVGTKAVRDAVLELLADLKTYATTSDYIQKTDLLRQYCGRIEEDYLDNWHAYISLGNIPEQSYELVARALLSHMLDAGFDRSHLHGWLKSRTVSGADLLALVSDARTMEDQGVKTFDFLIPFEKMSQKVSDALGDHYVTPENYVTLASQVPQRLVKSIRKPAGAARVQVQAKDPHAASRMAHSWAQRLKARISVGLEITDLRTGDYCYDETGHKLRRLRPEMPEVRVPSLQRNSILIPDITNTSQSTAKIDDALELLASLEQSSAGASIATTWAAVESLLGQPGGKNVEAADRLADIVTCAFPSAEFSHLAQAKLADHETGSDLQDLRNEKATSAVRSDALLALIKSGRRIEYAEADDDASFIRAHALAHEPKEVMGRIRGYYTDAFRRLYYQRNLVMHAGRFDSVSLSSTVRTLPILTAAGVDRIIRAHFANGGIDAIGLAARAKIELNLLGSDGARPIHRLI